MPKKNAVDGIKKNDAPLNGALKFFVGGCLAEIYLLMVRKYYVNGDVNQMLSWDAAMPALIGAGAAVLLLGAVLAAVWRKDVGWRRTLAWSVICVGAFFSVGNWLIRAVYPTAVTLLSVAVAAGTLLGVFWCLYARDCFFAMTILGTGLFASWVCRHGMSSVFWKMYVIGGAVVYLALLAGAALVGRRAERGDGTVGTLRILPKGGDATVLFVSCGLSAAATVVSAFSAAAAYYAMWALGIVIFILAVFYTVKEL